MTLIRPLGWGEGRNDRQGRRPGMTFLRVASYAAGTGGYSREPESSGKSFPAPATNHPSAPTRQSPWPAKTCEGSLAQGSRQLAELVDCCEDGGGRTLPEERLFERSGSRRHGRRSGYEDARFRKASPPGAAARQRPGQAIAKATPGAFLPDTRGTASPAAGSRSAGTRNAAVPRRTAR
jgi:hypothetical protein